MKKFVYGAVVFSAISVTATLFVWWDTAPAKSDTKYRAEQIGSKLGPETRWPIQPGPAIWKFECVGSEKDCGPSAKATPAVVNTVPEPGTLALLGLGFAGLAGLAWRKRK